MVMAKEYCNAFFVFFSAFYLSGNLFFSFSSVLITYFTLLRLLVLHLDHLSSALKTFLSGMASAEFSGSGERRDPLVEKADCEGPGAGVGPDGRPEPGPVNLVFLSLKERGLPPHIFLHIFVGQTRVGHADRQRKDADSPSLRHRLADITSGIRHDPDRHRYTFRFLYKGHLLPSLYLLTACLVKH